jgi:hypothetical protein
LTTKAGVLSYEVMKRAIPQPLFCPGRKTLIEKQGETEGGGRFGQWVAAA